MTRSASATCGGHSPLRENTRASGSAARNAAAAPPSPTMTGRSNSSPSRMAASVEYPVVPTTVFTDGSLEPSSFATANLCGVVTLAPTKPSASSPRTASARSSGPTSMATYSQSSPRTANAAFCMRGESECATGWPSSATTLVAVETLVVDEIVVVVGEVVVHLVRLADEVEPVTGRRMCSGLDRREPGIRDRRRRQPEDVRVPRVVRVVARELRLGERLRTGNVQAVARRRVDAEIHVRLQAVVDHTRDLRPLIRR